MTVLATLLLPAAMTSIDATDRLATPVADVGQPPLVAALFYPPDDPEGPDDAGEGEGEGSGGEAGGQ